ncbi:MAG TPA: hypothetical protein VHM90_04375 [Phycisphaerae bacterium]|nr:hypothetical protein [Phycisphaerae bacterium]
MKLQERLKELIVERESVYPGAPNVKHVGIDLYLIERLKGLRLDTTNCAGFYCPRLSLFSNGI